MFCSNCGKEIAEESNFCMHCGYKTAITEDSKEVRPPQRPIEAEKITPEKIVPLKAPYQPSLLFRVFYIIAWIYIIGGGLALSILPSEDTPSMLGISMGFWVGVLSAMIAKKSGKSGWLWFFIGIPIGFVLFVLIIFFKHLGIYLTR